MIIIYNLILKIKILDIKHETWKAPFIQNLQWMWLQLKTIIEKLAQNSKIKYRIDIE